MTNVGHQHTSTKWLHARKRMTKQSWYGWTLSTGFFSSDVVRWFCEYWCTSGPCIQKSRMDNGKEHSYETTVLVPARWSQLLLYHSLPWLSQREIWRSDHWPPCSPDLSLLDFSVWDYVAVNMKKRQQSTIESVNVILNMFYRAWVKIWRSMSGRELCSVFRRRDGNLNNWCKMYINVRTCSIFYSQQTCLKYTFILQLMFVYF